MESSSEDSFLWTDASNDSSVTMPKEVREKPIDAKSDSSDYKAQVEIIKKRHYCDNNASYDYSNSQDIFLEVKVKEEAINNKRKKKMKLESESELDAPKKKSSKGCDTLSHTSVCYDESFLEDKVKQEKAMASTFDQILNNNKNKVPNDKKVKDSPNKGKSTPIGVNYSCSSEDTSRVQRQVQHSEEDSYSKSKNKKKKSKKKYISDNEHSDMVEDKLIVKESISKHQDGHANKSGSKLNGAVEDNLILQEGNEEGSCDEISAIKGDDDHDLHSTLFDEKNANDCNMHRRQTISDRIRFEEDDSNKEPENYFDSDTSKPVSNLSSKINHHLKVNTYLKPLTEHLHRGSILTSDDELWMLKCPKEIDVTAFKDIHFKTDGKVKIKIGGQSYEAIGKKEKSDLITVLSMQNNQHHLKNLPLSGVINLRKKIPKLHYYEDNIMINNQTNFIPLPETKCRHPLFGCNYKKALKIPSRIKQRLKTQCVTRLSVDPEIVKEKEKKKKKRKNIEEPIEAPAPKKKRIKHHIESEDAWESEKAIEENLFNF